MFLLKHPNWVLFFWGVGRTRVSSPMAGAAEACQLSAKHNSEVVLYDKKHNNEAVLKQKDRD